MRVPPPRKQPMWKRRSRNYLTPNEVDRLIQAARKMPRHEQRNSTMILLAFRHGFRASELVSLKWDQVNLKEGFLNVHRLKAGQDATHPLWGPELRALRSLQRDYANTQYVFTTERKTPITARTYQQVVVKVRELAESGFPISSNCLRHSTGFKLANDGQDIRAIAAFLDHKNLHSTVRYTQLVSGRFKGFWRD